MNGCTWSIVVDVHFMKVALRNIPKEEIMAGVDPRLKESLDRLLP